MKIDSKGFDKDKQCVNAFITWDQLAVAEVIDKKREEGNKY